MKWWIIALGFTGILALAGVGFLVLQPHPAPALPAQSSVKAQPAQPPINTEESAIAEKTISLTFVGDIMLDRYVRTTIDAHTPLWPFEKILSELIGDAVIGNLEGPFTDQPSVATNEHLIFTFDPSHAIGLRQAGFTDLSLANNHTLNFGATGLASTRTTLETQGLRYFGDPSNQTTYSRTVRTNDRSLTFVGYHGLVSGLDRILAEVRAAKETGATVIVMAHWGNEYKDTASSKQVQDAHALIEAGADIIIGAHPHVIQPIEIYHNKLIIYSLGNFLFDQYFSPETVRGLVLHLALNQDALSVQIVPVITVRGQIEKMSSPDRDALLVELAKTSTISSSLANDLSRGLFTLPFSYATQ